MSLLASAALVGAGVLVGVVVALVADRSLGVDPMASFAGVMALSVLSVIGYVLVVGFGRIEPAVELSTLLSPTLAFALLASLALVRRMERPDPRWVAALRERFLLGVPWGTLFAVALVLAVYVFLQHGGDHWNDPVTVSFRAWSFDYPLGIVVSGFAHNGPGHLIGNLVGTVVVGSIAEYAWGHYPTERGEASFGSLRTNPWARAFLVYPGAIVATGLLMGLFSMGPVIGFSGVVFALVGFALVRYPMATVAATVAEGAVWQLYLALRNPIFVAVPSASPPSPPGWATIAIQIHALGLLVGIGAGAYVFWNRENTPSPLRLWTGVALIGMTKGLWALYWFRGGNQYVLFRGPGLVAVALLALVVTTALAASNTPAFWPSNWLTPKGVATDGGDPTGDREQAPGVDGTDPPRPAGSAAPGGSGDGGISYRTIAVLILVLVTGVVAGFGAASNAFTVGDTRPPDDAVQVGDFDVYYAEGVTNQRVAVVNLSFFNETTQVETSGVIVASEERNIWITMVSKDRLAFTGVERIRLGGVGWEESVLVTREGWVAEDGPTAYKVRLQRERHERRLAYASEPAEAAPTIDGRNVSILPAPEGFVLLVTRNNTTVGTAAIPEPGESVRAGGLTFERVDDEVYAVANETRVRIAKRESYR